MDNLLKAIMKLRINGNPAEEKEFERFKLELVARMRDMERKVMHELHEHHSPSVAHSVMVARDVNYIAKNMGYPDDKVRALTTSALLHDVGKVDIHNAVIDSVSPAEQEAAFKAALPGVPVPGELKDVVTLRQVIAYRSRKAEHPKEYVRLFEQWLSDKGLSHFLDKSFNEYIHHHQTATRRILKEIGVSDEMVDYAAGHHPDYFSDAERHKLPKECRIIEVADKFNAITQSGAVRDYITKESRAKALEIITHQLKKEFGILGIFEKRALGILVRRYLIPEINKLVPDVESLIRHMKHRANELRNADGNDAEVEKAHNELALIAATLALSKEFGNVLDHSTESSLEAYEEELTNVLSRAA